MTTDTKLSFEDECFQWASGFYLSDHCPDEYFTWDDEEQNEWIKDNNWQPFEYWEPKDVCEQIASLAHWIENGKYPKKEKTT